MNPQNLKPFAKGFDERRQVGRKPGSRNVGAFVKNLLNNDLPDVIGVNSEVKKLLANSQSNTMVAAIVFTLYQKAIGGDIRASKLLLDYLEKAEWPNFENAFGIYLDDYE